MLKLPIQILFVNTYSRSFKLIISLFKNFIIAKKSVTEVLVNGNDLSKFITGSFDSGMFSIG